LAGLNTIGGWLVRKLNNGGWLTNQPGRSYWPAILNTIFRQWLCVQWHSVMVRLAANVAEAISANQRINGVILSAEKSV